MFLIGPFNWYSVSSLPHMMANSIFSILSPQTIKKNSLSFLSSITTCYKDHAGASKKIKNKNDSISQYFVYDNLCLIWSYQISIFKKQKQM